MRGISRSSLVFVKKFQIEHVQTVIDSKCSSVISRIDNRDDKICLIACSEYFANDICSHARDFST